MRPAGQKVNMVAAQGASSSPTEKVDTLFAPPTEFLNSPLEASTPPPDTSQPPMSLTSDLGRFQNPSHSAAPDHLLIALMSTQRAPEDASHSSLDQAGSDRPRTPSQTEPSSGYDIFSAPLAGGGLSRPVVAEGGSIAKEANLFHPFPNNTHFLDRPFQPPSSTQEGQNLSVSDVADLVPTQELDIFQTQPKEGAKLFQTPLPKSENDPFQTPLPNGTDIFNNPFSAGNDVYGAPKAKSDIFSVLPPTLPNRPPDTTLTTPLRSKHGILQPTPFSLALASTATPQQSPTDLPSIAPYNILNSRSLTTPTTHASAQTHPHTHPHNDLKSRTLADTETDSNSDPRIDLHADPHNSTLTSTPLALSHPKTDHHYPTDPRNRPQTSLQTCSSPQTNS
ncbi:unnamed protein product [Merluccius merluccius]